MHLPYALNRKYPNAGSCWGWQYVFPAISRLLDRRIGKMQNHHVDEQAIRHAVVQVVRLVGLVKPGSPHTLQHFFATHQLQNGQNIDIPRRAGTGRPWGCADDDDLHSCFELRWSGIGRSVWSLIDESNQIKRLQSAG